MPVHIGNKIKEVLYQKRIPAAKFARMLDINPKGISRILKKQDLHCKLLGQISELLGHNFFQYYMPTGEEGKDGQSQLDFLKEKIAVQEKELEMLKKENGYLKQINELLAAKK